VDEPEEVVKAIMKAHAQSGIDSPRRGEDAT
jgi:hypothetical protein